MTNQPPAPNSVRDGGSHKFITRLVYVTPFLSDLPEYLRKRIKVQHYDKSKVSGDCWVWTGSLNEAGYPRVDWNGKRNRMAHKVVYELFNGPVAAGLEVDHLCTNPPCVNPAHLEAVTPAENLRRSHTTGYGNGTRTHCRQGHAFTPDNIYSWRGKRFCLKCQSIRQAKYENAKAAKLSAETAGTVRQAAPVRPQSSASPAPVARGGSQSASGQSQLFRAAPRFLSTLAWRVSGSSLIAPRLSFPSRLVRFQSTRLSSQAAGSADSLGLRAEPICTLASIAM